MSDPAEITPESSAAPAYLSPRRRRQSKAQDATTRSLLEQAQSDRSRVIYSSSFRRLAQKTQVFALDAEEVRSRMTHSLEVAGVGMYLVDTVFKLIDSAADGGNQSNEWSKLTSNQRTAIRSFVETACLVHDLGNPPFAHFGEKAIRSWFEHRKEEQWFKDATTAENSGRDFLHFDGNMQGFRILTRLQRNLDDSYGLNLTLSQLASAVKYPTFNKERPEKCGFFASEESIKRFIWAELGLEPNQRHPLSLLMESADDIAYCFSDIEDAWERKIVSDDHVKEAFSLNDFVPGKSFTYARTVFTNSIVKKVAKKFVERLEDGSILESKTILQHDETLLKQKEIAQKYIYSSRLVLGNEITGFSVIHGLLDHFSCLLKIPESDFKLLAAQFLSGESFYEENIRGTTNLYTQEISLLSFLSKKYLKTYLESVAEEGSKFPEMFHRMHLIIDHIAGMTDPFALNTFRLVSGQVLYGHRH